MAQAKQAEDEVRKLVQEYLEDPLGHGVHAMNKLIQGYANGGDFAGAVDRLTDSPDLDGTELKMAENLVRTVKKPDQQLIPNGEIPFSPKPTPEAIKVMVEVTEDPQLVEELRNTYIELENHHEKFADKVENNTNGLQDDMKAVLASGALDAQKAASINQWASGHGPQQYLGPTILYTNYDHVGSAVTGKIAGGIDASRADDMTEDPLNRARLGKIHDEMNDVAKAAGNINNKLGPLQSKFDNIMDKSFGKTPGPPKPTPYDGD